MSKVQVDTIVDKDDISAPTFSKGAIVTGVCTATTFVGALSGNATSATTATTASGNAGGLTGTPDITVGNVTSANVTNSKQTTSEHVNVTGISTLGGDVSIADKIIHTGDTDTAIRFPDANVFSVETGGTERLRILSDGKVGIGTTIPTRSFDVRGDATIGIDQHSGNPGTTVGILTVRGHHVNSDSEYAQLYLANSNSSGGSTASIRGNRETSNNATSLSFFTNHTSSAGNGDERLRIGTNGQLGLSAGGVGVAATDFGTSGQVLTSGGSGATATWADASGGAWENLTSGTWTSGTTKDITTTHLTSSHQLYRLTFHFHLDDAGESGTGLRLYTGGAWQTTGYLSRYLTDASSGQQTNRDRFPFGASATMMRECMGTVEFAYPDESSHVMLMHAHGTTNNESGTDFSEVILWTNAGGYNTAGAVTGLRFYSTSQAATWGWYVLEGCAIS